MNTRSSNLILSVVLTILIVAGGCKKDGFAPVVVEAKSSPSNAPKADPHPPMSPPTPSAPTGDGETKLSVDLKGDASWVTEAPTNNMRAAQFKLAKVDGDATDAELVIFYFGSGQGGDWAQNVARWGSQVLGDDGKPTKDIKESTSQNAYGDIMIFEARGTYNASNMVTKESTTNPGFVMVAAMVPTANGNFFPRFTGPEKTVARWRESVMSYIKRMAL